MWSVIVLSEVQEWFLALEAQTADQVEAAIDMLADVGPTLGRPLVDKVKASKFHNMKELRPGSGGATEVRILFIFDAHRQAILLVGGDKAGNWEDWYRENISAADERFTRWKEGD